MSIKGLLLGSAAALVAVSGARAADAVVMPEPEPADYVRVCDVYGKGFYYIPGTQTCFGIGGYLRYDTTFAGDPAVNLEGDDYQAGSSYRLRMNFDAREETELGTLRSFVRLQTTNTSGTDNGVQIDQAFAQLGGLLVGYRDSMWSSDIGGIEDGLLTDTDLVVGDFNTNQASYTFAANGFSATLGIEDDGTGDVVPDIHGKLVYSGAWGSAFLSGVYDETFSAEDIDAAFGLDPLLLDNVSFRPVFLTGTPTLLEDGNNGAFALKAGLSLKDLIFADSTLKFEGHYAFDPTVYASIPGIATVASLSANDANILNPTPGALPIFLEWAAGAGYAQAFGKLGVAVAGQYGETFDTAFLTRLPNGTVGYIESSADYYAGVLNVGYAITDNFATLAEVSYKNVDFEAVGQTDQVAGFLRFQRDF
ncbi:porin [Aureimonas sp. AU12]|uniref:porin n=1 Tax=Aureimonas sp. AU12 TaxID=1638161 RepID=UPI000782E5A3|nr:porin [Aureimonas sp. AU12]